MNNYWLFIILTIILLIVVKKNQFDFSTPATLFVAGFVLSSFFLALNTNRWDYEISSFTIFLVVLCVIVFAIGCNIGNRILIRNHRKIAIGSVRLKIQCLNIFIIIICIGCCAIRMLDVYERTGTLNIFIGAIRLYRYTLVQSRYSSLVKISTAVITAAVIYQVINLIDSFFDGIKKRVPAIITIVLGLIYFALSSSRIEILYVFIYIAIAYFYALKLHGKRVNLKTVVYGLSMLVILFVAFYAAGYLTGKSQLQTSLFDNISLYAGSSIGALDIWLQDFDYSDTHLGSVILSGLNNFLTMFGIKMNTVLDPKITFINIGKMNHTTNIFTCIAELISDVNYIFAFIIILLEGIFSQVMYRRSKLCYMEGNRSAFYLYLYLAPLIAMSSISERFFSTFLTFSTVIFVVLINVFDGLAYDEHMEEDVI